MVWQQALSYEKRGEWKKDDAEDIQDGGEEQEQKQEEEEKEGRWKRSIGNNGTSGTKKAHVSAVNHNRRRSNSRRFHGARPERWGHTRLGLQDGDVEQGETWSYTAQKRQRQEREQEVKSEHIQESKCEI